MAKTVCLACDKTYGDRLKQCPHCFTTNFFADDDPVVLVAAVNVLVAECEAEDAAKKKTEAKTQAEKLQELRHVAASLLPKRPWYIRLWRFLTRRAA